MMVSPLAIADARRLADGLGPLPSPEARPAIVVVSGLPGTGKTYFARQLTGRLPFVILESDALRKILFPEPTYSAAESGRLFQAIHHLIEELLSKGIPITLDATNLAEYRRERLYNIAERRNACLILVRVEAPPVVVKERLQARSARKKTGESSDADWAVYEKLRATAEKIRRRHYVVDTSKDITPVLDKIVKEIKR